MSEPLFELHSVRTVENIQEAQRYLLLKSKNAVMLNCAIVVCFLLNLAVWIRTRESLSLVAGIVMLAALGVRFWFGRWVLRTTAQREQETFNGVSPEVGIQIYDDRLCSQVNGGQTETMLSDFKKVYRTEHLIVAQTKANLMYILPTDAFTKGTPEDCVRFFASKGIKVS